MVEKSNFLETLVQYGPPKLLSTTTAAKKVFKQAHVDYIALEKAAIDGKNEECLNALIPPREYQENN